MSEERTAPWHELIDFTSDSVRLIANGERIKCVIIMDVTTLDDEQRKLFMERALTALTRMGDKVINRRNLN